jgi:modulator of FtsH protease HflC
MNRIGPIVIGALVALLLLNSIIFTVDQRQTALVRQFGEVVEVYKDPGLKFKLPLIQNVLFFDRRILTNDAKQAESFLTSEKKNVLVDSFIKWRVIDAQQFYVSVGGDEDRAATRIRQTVNDGLRAEFGKRTVHDVVSGQRDQIMKLIQQKADVDARKIGVEVVDVRLKRVDLSDEVSVSVYGRMEAERKRDANDARATGAADAEKIRADADKQKDIIIAEAYREAERVKGEGDAKASATYAAAYGKNPEFYAFYRSMQAYRESFRNKNDLMVLDPSSDFFKYMKNPRAAGGN